ncbi:Nucleoporin NUP145 [Golovinomyces cichoracearum]|uniref:Nucleoporin NUP145 n=1 Tax=Golovinomyces cichoracearum TaxID=62708 RepID=A0A420ICH4_9PEZI|nr:Nucleoporin NUP145 [Golovinomyces cichoracearum]
MSGFGGFGSFGQNSNQQPAATGFGTFGTNTGTGFGAATTTGFGSNNASSTGAFGNPSAFGTATNNAFGAAKPTGFGITPQAGSGLFGTNNTSTTGAFGSTGFGSNTAPSSGFGAGNTGGNGLFGASTTNSPFGGAATTSSAFGAPAQSLISQTGAGECQGTGSVPFQAFVEKEPNSSTNQQNSFQNIAFQAPYQKFSMEELRLADYNQGRRFGNGSNQPGAFGQSNFGGFGSNNSGFGASSNTTGANMFGAATTSSPFGTNQQPSTGFGTSTATTGNSLFGSKPTTGGVFGSQPAAQPTSGLFGSSNTAFGQQTTNAFGTNNSSGSVFGQNQAAKSPFSFGTPSNNTNPTPFGTSTSTGFGSNGGLFGNNNQQQPASTGFGTQQATSNGFGTFGTSNPPTGTTSLFGNNQAKPTGSLFGTPATTNSTSLFGQSQATPSTNAFGAPSTTQNSSGLFGNKPTGSGTDNVFGSVSNPPANNNTNLFGGFGNSNQNQTGGLFGNLGNNNNNCNNQPKPSVFGTAQPTGGSSLFGNPGTQNQSSLFGGFGSSQQQQQQQQPNQSSLFGTSNNSFSAQPQNNQVAQSLTASIGDNSAFGSQSLFSNITATQVSNPGPIATPLSGSRNSTGPKNAAIPLYKLNSGSASRFSTPQKRGFGFSYSTYGSPSSATSTASTPGAFSNNNLLGTGSFSRTLSKSMSTSSLRRSFNAEDSILAPGAFSASSGSRHFGGAGSVKKLTISRNIRSDLFGPLTPQSQPTTLAPSSGILKKHVSFDSNINGNGAGATSPSKQLNNTTSNSTELGFKRPHSNNKSNKSPSSEIEPVPNSNNQLAIVREEESLDAADSSASVPAEEKNQGDYWMSPSKAELESMNRIQRKTVTGFTVGRYGIGSVQFDVPVDLTSVNLNDIMDNIVRIEVRQVTVYPDNYKKPPMGKGLNVPSTITLENSWPRKKDRKTPLTDQSGIRLQKHIDKLKRVEGTDFVNYEKTTGTWTFRVPHFTTYGLPEEDEEDDVMESELSSHEDQTRNFDSYNQSFASNSLLTQTESGLEDTFEFRKSKRFLPGTFDDQELYYDPEDNFQYLEHVSLAENQSSGSQSECSTEEPSEKYDVLNDNESVSIIDQDMVGTYPETLNDMQILNPLSDEGEDSEISRLDASIGYNTPSRGNFLPCDDWVSTLRATVSPKKKDRALLKTLLELQDNKTQTDSEETPTQNRVIAEEQGFSSSIDLMNSLFGEKRSPSKNSKAIKKDKISEYQNSIRSKISDHNDVQADETERSLLGPMKPRWGFDGTLIYAAPIPGRGSRIKDDLLAGLKSEIVSEHRDVRFAKFSNEASAEFLNKYKAIAVIDCSSGVPMAALPKPLLFTDFIDDHTPHHEKLVWQLASILWDPLQIPEELREIPHIISRIRKDNLSKFWKKMVDDSSSRQVALARCHEEKVIACLSGHKIDDACSYLVNIGDLRLSTLIALIGSKDSIKDDIRFQIDAWKKSNMLSEMTQPIRALYEILAGNVCVCSEVKGAPEDRVESFSISKRFGLNWRQAFGLRLWYGISSHELIEAAVSQFAHDISEEKEESLPTPWYIEQKVPLLWEDLCVNQREDLLWGMLKLYTYQDSDLEDVLRPENSQLSPMDIRLSWQLSQAITSSGSVNFAGDNDEKFDRTTLSFAAQLVNEGHWLDAIFILLHLTSPRARFMAIQDHLGRYAGYIGGEDCPVFIKLTNTYKIPTAWIWEAKALYLRSVDRDPQGEVECLIKSGSFNEAHETFSREVAPKLIIELDYSSLRNLLVGFAGKDHKIKDWSLGVGLYSDYLDFIENFNKGLPADESALENLLSKLPSLADESRHPNFMEKVAIETMSSTAANALLGVVKNGDKNSLAKVLNLPLTEDQYLRHSIELSKKYYSSLMKSFK